MKKQLLAMATLLVVGNVALAQCPIEKGQAQLNAGVGFSNFGLPVYVGLDYGVHKDITVGGEVSFRSYNNTYGNTKYKHSIIGIAGNANYHFNSILAIPTKWDLYAGLNIGYYIYNSSGTYAGAAVSGLGVGGQIGGRYYFTDKVGINLELGGANVGSGGKLGVSVKL
jgi:outer membrane immunogenic protein